MAQMGFGVKCPKWIYACLSSALISILINGSPSREFPIKRDLRQGDPLSPFLFLIVAEALQVMITDACNKDRWILEEGVWQGKWDWTRQPSGRADGDLAKLMSDLNGLPLDEAQDDF
ncbi:arginine repressor C-terminal-like domain-containing protein [Tanacetum coccineum]